MLVAIAFALVAGMMWGVAFVGPLLLPDYPAAIQSFGRYLAFGLIALPIGWFDQAELLKLTRSDWFLALKLSAIGNVLYYLCLASAIQLAGGPVPTMIIGTLPIVITICSNLLNHQRDGHLPWLKLAPAIAIVLVGIACVNQVEFATRSHTQSANFYQYLIGILLAIAAVICWTWYPLQNAKWLRDHPTRNSRAWATAQGLVTLPLALLGYAIFWGATVSVGSRFAMPFGPRPAIFIAIMVVIGLFASWVGTMCWNEASQRLSTAVVGQLIVFETIAALTYTYLLRGQWPEPLTLFGIGLLIIGVFRAVKIKPKIRSVD